MRARDRTGTGARKRQARKPKRKAPGDVDPVIRRTTVPVRAAAASSEQRQDDEVARVQRRRAEDRDDGRGQPHLAPVVPGLGRQALDAGRSPRASRSSRSRSRPGRAQDRVVGRRPLNSSGWTPSRGLRRQRRAVEQRDGDDEHARRRGRRRPGSDVGADGAATRSRTPIAAVRRTVAGVRPVGGAATAATTASPIAMAKPTATGVNELRPPDAIAAHQAASTRRPEASPTPSVSPAGASASAARRSGPSRCRTGGRPRRTAGPGRSTARPSPIGERDRRTQQTRAGLYRRPVGDRPRPDSQGMRSTWVSPLGRDRDASGHERVRMHRVRVDVVDAVGLQERGDARRRRLRVRGRIERPLRRPLEQRARRRRSRSACRSSAPKVSAWKHIGTTRRPVWASRPRSCASQKAASSAGWQA